MAREYVLLPRECCNRQQWKLATGQYCGVVRKCTTNVGSCCWKSHDRQWRYLDDDPDRCFPYMGCAHSLRGWSFLDRFKRRNVVLVPASAHLKDSVKQRSHYWPLQRRQWGFYQ